MKAQELVDMLAVVDRHFPVDGKRNNAFYLKDGKLNVVAHYRERTYNIAIDADDELDWDVICKDCVHDIEEMIAKEPKENNEQS